MYVRNKKTFITTKILDKYLFYKSWKCGAPAGQIVEIFSVKVCSREWKNFQYGLLTSRIIVVVLINLSSNVYRTQHSDNQPLRGLNEFNLWNTSFICNKRQVMSTKMFWIKKELHIVWCAVTAAYRHSHVEATAETMYRIVLECGAGRNQCLTLHICRWVSCEIC